MKEVEVVLNAMLILTVLMLIIQDAYQITAKTVRKTVIVLILMAFQHQHAYQINAAHAKLMYNVAAF